MFDAGKNIFQTLKNFSVTLTQCHLRYRQNTLVSLRILGQIQCNVNTEKF